MENTLGGMQQREQSIEWPHPLNDIVKLILLDVLACTSLLGACPPLGFLPVEVQAHIILIFIANKYGIIEITIAIRSLVSTFLDKIVFLQLSIKAIVNLY